MTQAFINVLNIFKYICTIYNAQFASLTSLSLLVGSDCVYNLFSVFLSYVSLAMLGPSIKNVLFNFIFHTVCANVIACFRMYLCFVV